MKTARWMAAAALLAGSGLTLHGTWAQPAGIGRTDLLQRDISVEGREVVQVRVDFAPGAKSEWHNHPGEEVAYVLEGSLEYVLEGRPPVTVHAGQALFIPARTFHSARNVGSGKASELATYIVRKGQPLVALPQ